MCRQAPLHPWTRRRAGVAGARAHPTVAPKAAAPCPRHRGPPARAQPAARWRARPPPPAPAGSSSSGCWTWCRWRAPLAQEHRECSAQLGLSAGRGEAAGRAAGAVKGRSMMCSLAPLPRPISSAAPQQRRARSDGEEQVRAAPRRSGPQCSGSALPRRGVCGRPGPGLGAAGYAQDGGGRCSAGARAAWVRGGGGRQGALAAAATSRRRPPSLARPQTRSK